MRSKGRTIRRGLNTLAGCSSANAGDGWRAIEKRRSDVRGLSPTNHPRALPCLHPLTGIVRNNVRYILTTLYYVSPTEICSIRRQPMDAAALRTPRTDCSARCIAAHAPGGLRAVHTRHHMQRCISAARPFRPRWGSSMISRVRGAIELPCPVTFYL